MPLTEEEVRRQELALEIAEQLYSSDDVEVGGGPDVEEVDGGFWVDARLWVDEEAVLKEERRRYHGDRRHLAAVRESVGECLNYIGFMEESDHEFVAREFGGGEEIVTSVAMVQSILSDVYDELERSSDG